MSSWSKLAVPSVLLIAGLVAIPALVAAEAAPTSGLVDFRMAPLEQAKKIHRHLHPGPEPGETKTVMSWDGTGDGRHLIVPVGQSKQPDYIAAQLTAGGFDSISWIPPVLPVGSCDSTEECEERTEEMCEDAGHDGVDEETVTITAHSDGSRTCSGDCNSNGAVAFVTCNPR